MTSKKNLFPVFSSFSLYSYLCRMASVIGVISEVFYLRDSLHWGLAAQAGSWGGRSSPNRVTGHGIALSPLQIQNLDFVSGTQNWVRSGRPPHSNPAHKSQIYINHNASELISSLNCNYQEGRTHCLLAGETIAITSLLGKVTENPNFSRIIIPSHSRRSEIIAVRWTFLCSKGWACLNHYIRASLSS